LTWDSSAPESLARSAAWNTKPMQPRYWRRALKTAPWLRRLSGLMSAPSTVARGVESWISSLAASPVRTSATQGPELEWKASDPASGLSSRASFARWDRDSSSWRTSQLSLFVDSTSSSVTWPKWGSMRSGAVFERPTWEPLTEENESSSSQWITPRTAMASMYSESRETLDNRDTGGGKETLATQVAGMWPTPDAFLSNDGQSAETYENRRRRRLQEKHRNGNGAGLVLSQAAIQWPTASASASDGKGIAAIGQRKGQLSESAELLWPTPQSYSSGKDGNSTPGLTPLDLAARPDVCPQYDRAILWATATATDSKASGMAAYAGKRTGYQGVTLTDQACRGLLAPLIEKGGKPTSTNGRRLNPRFVEALMGWPIGFSDCGFSEMESSQTSQNSPGECSGGD